MPSTRTILTALALSAVLPATVAQAADTSAKISPSFSPNHSGANASFTLKAQLHGGPDGIPERLSKVVVRLPAGMGLDPSGARTCSLSRLRASGPHACPSGSRIGSGSSLLASHLGSQDIEESADLTVFRVPNQNGHPTFAISGQGYTPLYQRVTFTGQVLSDHAPYSRQIVTSIPAIPTLRGEPNASVLSYSLKFASPMKITVPRSCPAGGFRFGASFTFVSQLASSTTATARCP
ncbi:MAG TPA: hypothetical protein VLJ42_08065 [Solirubrobacteraceae bacterium]|nr:hypothetical protein [Solirubrobacteraceae bacterium]